MRRIAALLAVCLVGGVAGFLISLTVPSAGRCTGDQYIMSCVPQSAIPQLTTPRPGLSGTTIFGVDFEGAPSPGTLRADGVKFAMSYLSGVPGKDWTRSQLTAYHADGIRTGVVFERGATDALGGCGEGHTDATAALNEANALGVPKTVGIPLAVDTSTSAAAVAAYFRCAHQILGSRTGVYGSYFVVAGLNTDGYTRCVNDYQTVAWSQGHVGCAGVYQSSINNSLSGLRADSVDFDHADSGSGTALLWPVPATAAICFGPHAQGSATCRAVHAKVRAWTAAATASTRAYAARGCPVLAQRAAWFAAQLKRHPKTKARSRGSALRLSRRAYRQRACGLFTQRANYFTGQVKTIERKYS